MVKKKLNIPKSKLKDLEGFEDVLDLVNIDKAEVHKRDTRPAQNFEIYDFLERESVRLKKLDQFFSNKVPILEEHGQYTSLIEQQKVVRNDLQKELCQKVKDENSAFQQFMSSRFNKFFDL
jgi:hypothetical protein